MKKLIYILIVSLLLSVIVFPQKTKVGGTAKVGGLAKAGIASSGGSSTLNTGLVGCWDLGEASGNAIDDSGNGNDLTANNAPGQSTGIGGVGNSRTFNGTNQFFSHTSNSNLQFGDTDWSIAIWAYIANNTQEYQLMSKDNSTTGNREFLVYYSGTNGNFRASICAAVDDCINVVASTFGVPTNNTWHMVFVGWNSTANQLRISIDDGTVNTVDTSNPQAVGSAIFEIGAREYTGFEQYLSGRLQYAGKWSKLLSGAEITELYNSGAGKSCPY